MKLIWLVLLVTPSKWIVFAGYAWSYAMGLKMPITTVHLPCMILILIPYEGFAIGILSLSNSLGIHMFSCITGLKLTHYFGQDAMAMLVVSCLFSQELGQMDAKMDSCAWSPLVVMVGYL